MSLSLTELRANLFALADHVVESGEPLLIERRGVRLRLVREDAQVETGRLIRLVSQSLSVGAPLDPSESPAVWAGADAAFPIYRAAEPEVLYPFERAAVVPVLAIAKRQRRGVKLGHVKSP